MATIPSHTTNHQEPDTLLKFHVSNLLNTIIMIIVCSVLLVSLVHFPNKWQLENDMAPMHISSRSLCPKLDDHAMTHMPYLTCHISHAMTGNNTVSGIDGYMEFVGQQHCIFTPRTHFVVWSVWDEDKLVRCKI